MISSDLDALLDVVVARVADRVAAQVVERLQPLLKDVHDAAAASELLDTPAAAVRLGCSTQFLEIARHDGTGPRYHKIGKRVRYALADLDAFLTTRARDSTARPFRAARRRKRKPADAETTGEPHCLPAEEQDAPRQLRHAE